MGWNPDGDKLFGTPSTEPGATGCKARLRSIALWSHLKLTANPANDALLLSNYKVGSIKNHSEADSHETQEAKKNPDIAAAEFDAFFNENLRFLSFCFGQFFVRFFPDSFGLISLGPARPGSSR